MIPKNYRPNVGIMLINQDGLIWMGKRVNADDYAYQWQMPQGGIDAGETPIEAAWRELYEETGLKKDSVKFFVESSEWLCYTFPSWIKRDPFIGQCQKWFLFQFLGKDSDFKLDVHPEEIEFSAFQWVEADKISDMVVPFKKEVYQKVVQEFKPFLKMEK